MLPILQASLINFIRAMISEGKLFLHWPLVILLSEDEKWHDLIPGGVTAQYSNQNHDRSTCADCCCLFHQEAYPEQK